jgi:DNA/RNA-binding domain of Phe-tRNA-synthetase-like protein
MMLGSLPPALRDAAVDDEVFDLRPDIRALLIVAEGLRGGPTDVASDAALADAEERARALLMERPLDEVPQILEWRDAYRSFGVKPRQARSSVESLIRRAARELPRIDRLTDIYNAVSVERLVSIGGEDLGGYEGPPRLVRAIGVETFETVSSGEPTTENADPGEVVWRDDRGVTCRRWNWRQCARTRLTADTVNALFILDGLAATEHTGLLEAGADLVARLETANPGVTITSRFIAPPDPHTEGTD